MYYIEIMELYKSDENIEEYYLDSGTFCLNVVGLERDIVIKLTPHDVAKYYNGMYESIDTFAYDLLSFNIPIKTGYNSFLNPKHIVSFHYTVDKYTHLLIRTRLKVGYNSYHWNEEVIENR